ncbi:hypothetical protein ACTOB_004363 [Actinoplanes oblitus]|uniref:Uncharacterized protein n=1 Tax=Actinoplanes oblitus TaxID=3040509 RepID=A0ABY8WS24_9ACTN|nr:hypothetical protein [Actinoplanes oblitus]WIN00646.1 hypothetical protein ACTOB_004363 [Actinoplanes oblitus]
MDAYDTYGTSAYPVAELARLLTEQLGVSFIERDSCYRGVYLVADAGTQRVEIQPNAIPGDDDEDDFYDGDHPGIQTLVLVSGPHRDNPLTAHLDSIDALTALRRHPAR